ncbi:MAG TPA: hypothetical protein VGD98_03895 [Ktedonobacteraceae bacterium]
MNRFRQGMLIGLLMSVLLILGIALTLDEERRSQLRLRFEKLRDALPGIEQLKQSAQETAAKARATGSHLSEQVQESAGKVVQQTQEVLSKAQKQAASLDNSTK